MGYSFYPVPNPRTRFLSMPKQGHRIATDQLRFKAVKSVLGEMALGHVTPSPAKPDLYLHQNAPFSTPIVIPEV